MHSIIRTVGVRFLWCSSTLLIKRSHFSQTLFVLNGLRRSVSTHYEESLKPGRQYVTFLVVANTALWAVNSFEQLKATSHPVQMEFYGALPWSLITHISVPLAIFYRYHSTVCLADIWSEAYEIRDESHHH